MLNSSVPGGGVKHDNYLERILKAARKVYERRRKGSYDLFASDLR